MKNFIKQIQGFTLVEVVITILIEGFMIIVIMALLLNMNARLAQQKADMAILSEFRAAKITIRRELMNSRDVSIISGTEIDLYKVDGTTRSITYDEGNDEISIDNPSRIILTDVRNANFDKPFSGVNERMIDIFIQQEKIYQYIQVEAGTATFSVNLVSTFTVCVRSIL